MTASVPATVSLPPMTVGETKCEMEGEIGWEEFIASVQRNGLLEVKGKGLHDRSLYPTGPYFDTASPPKASPMPRACDVAREKLTLLTAAMEGDVIPTVEGTEVELTYLAAAVLKHRSYIQIGVDDNRLIECGRVTEEKAVCVLRKFYGKRPSLPAVHTPSPPSSIQSLSTNNLEDFKVFKDFEKLQTRTTTVLEPNIMARTVSHNVNILHEANEAIKALRENSLSARRDRMTWDAIRAFWNGFIVMDANPRTSTGDYLDTQKDGLAVLNKLVITSMLLDQTARGVEAIHWGFISTNPTRIIAQKSTDVPRLIW